MLIVHHIVFIEEVEQQAQDHADQSGEGHTLQGDTAQLDGYAGKTDYQNDRCQNCVSCSAVIYLGIYQDTQTGSA